MIDEPLYQKHKEYLDKEIDFTFDFSLFEYSVGVGTFTKSDAKKFFHKSPPPFLD